MSPNSSAVLGSVPRLRVGTASGTLAQMRVNGQALGIALSAAIVAIAHCRSTCRGCWGAARPGRPGMSP